MKTVLSIVLIFVIVLPGLSDKPVPSVSAGLSATYNQHRSYTPLYPSVPLRVGLPLFLSSPVGFELFSTVKTDRSDHMFTLSVSFPAQITSDNGTGHNFILDTNNSSYWGTTLEYRYLRGLFDWGRASFYYGFTPAVLFERKTMTYLSGHRNRWTDLDLGIGAVVETRYPVHPRLYVNGSFAGVVFLPYISRRWYESVNEEGIVITSRHTPLVYRSVLEFYVQWERGYGHISAGYRRLHRMGVVFRDSPGFTIDNIIHGLLEREHELYIAYSIKIR